MATAKKTTPKKSAPKPPNSMAGLSPEQKRKQAEKKAYQNAQGKATQKALYDYSQKKDTTKMGFIPGSVVKTATAKLDKIWKKGSTGQVARKK